MEAVLYLCTVHGRVVMVCIAVIRDLAVYLRSLSLSKSKITILCLDLRHSVKGIKVRVSEFVILDPQGHRNSHSIACSSPLCSYRLCLWCSMVVGLLQLRLTGPVILHNNKFRTENGPQVNHNSIY